MIAGTALTFTACSDDDEPTPDEPKTEDVYGNYTGTMTFKTEEEVANEANESGETAGIAVSATVKNDTVYFENFPVRDLVASIVGEKLADALVEAIGTVNYKVGYKASMTTAKDSVYMEMSPKPLELSIPVDVAKTTVSLKHAVTKLTLQTTVETSVEAGEAVRVTASCASSYNVAAPANSTFSSQTAEKVFEAATNFTGENLEVASFYFIPENEEQDVDVEFHSLKQTIESVPLVANIHVYLQGDLSEDNPKWENLD